METWITLDDDRLRLPITPTFNVQYRNNNQETSTNEVGGVNLAGKPALREVSFDSFFPAQRYDFVEFEGAEVEDPDYYVRKLKEWEAAEKPLRLIITETPFNFAVLITGFSPAEKDGTGDRYYTLELKEYVETERTEYSIPIEKRTVAEWYKWLEDAKYDQGVKTAKELYETKWAKAKSLTGEGENYKLLDKALEALKANPKELKKAKEAYEKKLVLRPKGAPKKSVGVTKIEGKPAKDLIASGKAKPMVVHATAYTPDPRENGGGNKTARGNPLTPYKYIAVDPKVIPYGTKVYIPEFRNSPFGGVFIADDCGGAIKGNKIDVLLPNKKTASKFGRKKSYTIYILG